LKSYASYFTISSILDTSSCWWKSNKMIKKGVKISCGSISLNVCQHIHDRKSWKLYFFQAIKIKIRCLWFIFDILTRPADGLKQNSNPWHCFEFHVLFWISNRFAFNTRERERESYESYFTDFDKECESYYSYLRLLKNKLLQYCLWQI